MPTVFNPNVAEVNLIHRWDGQQVENLLYFFSTVEPGQQDLKDLADGVKEYWQTNMLPLMSNQVAFLLAEVQKCEPVPAETASASADLPNTGGDTNPSMPNSTSITITFRTGLSGRSYRGRNFWLGLTEPNVVNSYVEPTLVASVVGAYNGMVGNDAVVTGWHWGVYSQYHNGVPRETGLFTSITNATVIDYVVDSQRRRLPGRGK